MWTQTTCSDEATTLTVGHTGLPPPLAMPLLLSRYQHDVAAAAAASRTSVILPLVVLVASLLAYIGTSTTHSLLTSAIAWLCLCLYTATRCSNSNTSTSTGTSTAHSAYGRGRGHGHGHGHSHGHGLRSFLEPVPAQRLCWAAGALLGLAQICERAVDGTAIWWAKVDLSHTVKSEL